jgi:hypothetical protein
MGLAIAVRAVERGPTAVEGHDLRCSSFIMTGFPARARAGRALGVARPGEANGPRSQPLRGVMGPGSASIQVEMGCARHRNRRTAFATAPPAKRPPVPVVRSATSSRVSKPSARPGSTACSTGHSQPSHHLDRQPIPPAQAAMSQNGWNPYAASLPKIPDWTAHSTPHARTLSGKSNRRTASESARNGNVRRRRGGKSARRLLYPASRRVRHRPSPLQSQGEPNMAGSTRGKSHPIQKRANPTRIITTDI